MKYAYTHCATTIMTTNIVGLSHSGLFYKIQDNLGVSIIICFYQVCHWLATDASCGRQSPSSPSKLFFSVYLHHTISSTTFATFNPYLMSEFPSTHTHTQLNKPTCLLGHNGRKIFHKQSCTSADGKTCSSIGHILLNRMSDQSTFDI